MHTDSLITNLTTFTKFTFSTGSAIISMHYESIIARCGSVAHLSVINDFFVTMQFKLQDLPLALRLHLHCLKICLKIFTLKICLPIPRQTTNLCLVMMQCLMIQVHVQYIIVSAPLNHSVVSSKALLSQVHIFQRGLVYLAKVCGIGMAWCIANVLKITVYVLCSITLHIVVHIS